MGSYLMKLHESKWSMLINGVVYVFKLLCVIIKFAVRFLNVCLIDILISPKVIFTIELFFQASTEKNNNFTFFMDCLAKI